MEKKRNRTRGCLRQSIGLPPHPETIDRTTCTSRKSARKHDTQAQKTEWGRKVIEVLGEEVVGGLEEHEVCDCLETRVKPKER
jgi:hypothetical protein